MTKTLTILLLLFVITVNGQSSDTTKRNRKYVDYLFTPDENTQSALVNFRAQYLYVQPDKPFRRGGLNFNFGLNLARFFSKKIILGVCLDTRFIFAGQTRQNFSQQFVSDFNCSQINSNPTLRDTVRSQVLYDAINSNGVTIKGNHPLYFGISFSPFPQKYGGILIEFKRGGSSYLFFGNYNAKLLSDHDENEAAMLLTYNNLAIDITFTPYKFFSSKRVGFDNSKVKDFYKFIVISLCCEKFSLKNAKFSGQPLSAMVSQDFISKYSDKYYFGIKLGIGIN